MTHYELCTSKDRVLYDGASVQDIYTKVIKDFNDGDLKRMPEADYLNVWSEGGCVQHHGKIYNDLMHDIYQVIGETGRYEEEDYDRYA